ncbi:hypothetical protein PRNP1_005440 [Phytophthora ramorum]
MRKLPSSASAGNLHQLVDASPSVALYSSNGSPMMMPTSSSPSVNCSIGNNNNSPNVVMSGMPVDANNMLLANSTRQVATVVNGEDRGAKKSSLAYRHTKFHRLLDDAFGKSYERRGCKYCDAVFSFKGGTTSAALRHVKTAHPERLVYNGGMSEQQSVQGDFSVTSDGNRSVNARASAQEPRRDAAVTDVVNEDFDRRNERVATGVDAAMVVASTVAESEEEGSLLSVETMSSDSRNDTRRPTAKRKRGEDEFIVDNESVSPGGGGNSGETSSERGSVTDRVNSCGSSSKLTASQRAIVHFLHHYANELPHPSMRLRFAKHLTHYAAEAEMYNVLDPATQLEYIREFAHPVPRNM